MESCVTVPGQILLRMGHASVFLQLVIPPGVA